MKTVNSLSGGKTSSYLAAHYPADYDIFALVCIDDHNAGGRIDKKLKQMANDKLQKHCAHMPPFVATAEDPIILKTMFDLEQHIGREITWVRGIGFEEMVRLKSGAIPNRSKRFCTTILKMQPIFEFLYMHTQLPVKMRVGYRYDEMERRDDDNTTFKFSYQMQYSHKQYRIHHRTGKITWGHWRNKNKTVTWRENDYVLINDKIIHPTIEQWAIDSGIPFALDSNCQNCFWKHEQQLRKNFDTNPTIMTWALLLEHLNGHTFRDNYSLMQIREFPLQKDFVFGTGSGCQAGFCTS